MHENFQVGSRIKELRQLKGLSQAELCREICSQSMLSRIEKEKNDASSHILLLLSQRLGVTLQHLFYEGESPVDRGIKITKEEIREACRRNEYQILKKLVQSQLKNPIYMKSDGLRQFLLWHESIYIYYLEKDIDKAKLKIEEGLECTKSDARKEPTEQEQGLLLSLAIFYAEEGDQHQTISLVWSIIEKMKQQMGEVNTTLLLRSYYTLSKAYHGIHCYDASIKYAGIALNLSIKKEDLYLAGELHYQRGESLHRKGENTKALEEFQQANWIFNRIELYSFFNIVVEHMNLIKNNKTIPFD